MGYRVINGKLHLIEDISSVSSNSSRINQSKNNGPDFKDFLNKEISKNEAFVISKHAEERLRQRNIRFNEADMKQINEGINKAEAKGSKDCLICYKGNALVTSIQNRTVITAMDQEGSKGNIFTNVDSVLFL